MGYEGQDFADIAGGVSPAFIEALYARYKAARQRRAGLARVLRGAGGRRSGPSWAQPDWPLDRHRRPDRRARSDADGAGGQAGEGRQARRRCRRRRAVADDDPQGRRRLDPRDAADPHLSRARAPRRQSRPARPRRTRELPDDLQDRISRLHRRRDRPPVYLGGTLGLRDGRRSASSSTSCAPITAATSASNTCTSPTSRSAASCRTGWRARTRRSSSPPEGKKAILNKVIEAEQWEKFLGRKYVGTKRFGLDGGESMIPALESVIKYGGADGRATRSCSAWRTAAG